MTRIGTNNSNTAAPSDVRKPAGQPETRSSFASLMGSETGLSGSYSASKSNQIGISVDTNKDSDSHAGRKDTAESKPEPPREKPTKDGENPLVHERGTGFQRLTLTYFESDQSLPPARSILHVADLERIVSTIRAQKIEGSSIVTVNLRHSIFEGLEFRVAFKQGLGLKAEFFAANETIRAAILERSSELIGLFKERGIDLGFLDVSLGGGNAQNDQAANQSAIQINPFEAIDTPDHQSSSNTLESRTSYLT